MSILLALICTYPISDSEKWMNINFIDSDRMSLNSLVKSTDAQTEYGSRSFVGSTESRGFSLDLSSEVTDEEAYRGKGRVPEDVMMNAALTDLDVQRDYMTVMSNCVSDEDFARMQKEGFDPGNMEIHESVTILDHIKTAMLRGGTEVYGYTDTVSDEALAEITGSSAYAGTLKDQFREKDLPLTEDTAAEVMESYEQLGKIRPLSEAGTKYLVENDLAPSVENLYQASFSGAFDANRQGHGYYASGNVAGYYAKKPDTVDIEALRPQMESIIREAGYEVSPETLKDASWLVEKGVPLTTDTFRRLEDINKVSLPMEFPEFADKASNALLDGIPVKKADLSRNTSYRQEAVDLFREVQTEGTIRGRRILEEVRLTMTAEANLKLLRSGFSIDTAPMEDLIRNLKEIEKEFALNLMSGEDEIDAVRKNDIYADTLSTVENIRTAPITISYRFSYEETLSVISEKADVLKADYAKATQSYEALMTAPRSDMGDSIKKAFRNVDEFLSENGEALTEENRRAVRILGYNSMEITSENIEVVKAKDTLLTDTIRNLTPGRVLGMIRNNVNPLSMPIEELNEYLKDQDMTREDMLSYSKFLYKLEQDKGITEDEREAYIGIYRMVRQIEKGDFSAVGAIEEWNAEFNFENLLSALRTRKHGAMDYKVDDSFGGMDVVDRGIASITTQIAKGFVTDTSDLWDLLNYAGDREAEKEFEQQEFEDIRKSFTAEEEVLRELAETGTPVTANNLADMKIMMESPSSVFTKLREKGYRKKADIKLDGKKEAQESYREYTGSIREFLNERVFGISEESRSLRAMDVREISSISRHMSFLDSQAQEENYEIPAEIGGELTAINLRIVHGADEGASVAISMESAFYGSINANFRMAKEGLEGLIGTENANAASRLREGQQVLGNALEKEGLFLSRMDVVVNTRNTHTENITGTETVSTDSLYKTAKVFIGFLQDTAAS